MSTTLRDLLGLGHTPSRLADATLILIDCQNTYREGIMQLEGVEDALVQARRLLDRARALSVPVIHIQHDAGEGSPYDIRARIGQIADIVAPVEGETVITKHYPNSFCATTLDEVLKAQNVKNIVLAGFMTHMCINSTAHGGFNLGYAPTVVANATATRALPGADGKLIPASQVHAAALAATRDLYAAIATDVDEVI
ncbi:Nicotinamidase-related amidase [Methylobacillus rhizosphaerae]|uniref:Nicotinamidase-related amidase n=1 Tax=Methylobacillus rhizosphaerae TaxID=551994 RepID=A0A238Z9T9_9PROT|nr:cysteine hydrolase family protein [Methylobacillus rhizosphaerae]SNR80276.1 Nicotinamidase-related amidase [Methylobacillus rhizosphaerae]